MFIATSIILIVLRYGACHERLSEDNGLTENMIGSNGQVFITISSLASYDRKTNKISERNVELNWYNLEENLAAEPDVWVGLFNHDPAEGTSDSLAKTYVTGISDGSFRTNVSYPYFDLDITKENHCLGYWIALVKVEHVLSKSCHSMRPNWMYEMRDIIGGKRLVDLMIPGTHNAGAYMRYNPDKDNIKIRYQMCHDENTWNQLAYGIRFLDLRVTYRDVPNSPEIFWISHDIFRTKTTVKEVLNSVKKFLELTKEIVVIDFHRFHLGIGINEKSTEKRHKLLMTMLVKELGDYAMPRSYSYKTLNEIWRSNKRLLVGYKSNYGKENVMFYHGVRHLWANVDNVEGLKKFFEERVCYQPKYTLWSAMAELTGSGLKIILDRYGGLRTMAQNVNLNVTRWFRDNWWNCANIVSTDYFLGNDIIDVSIESNKRKWEK